MTHAPMLRLTPRQVATAAALLGAAVLGFVLGWAFGQRAGGAWGTWVALAAALNGALFCSLLADWMIGRLAGVRAVAATASAAAPPQRG